MNNYFRILLIAIFLSSCSYNDKKNYDSDSYLERIYFKDTYLNKNYIGMTKKQIIYIFGLPIISDSFDDAYHYSIFRKVNKKFFQKGMLSLYFKDDKVSSYDIK